VVHQPAEQFDWKNKLIAHLVQRKDIAKVSTTVLDF
jgi:hypothetical protein